MMVSIANKIIYHNVILQQATIAQPMIQSVWQILHIAFHLMMKHATKIKEVFAIIQETHQLGAIF